MAVIILPKRPVLSRRETRRDGRCFGPRAERAEHLADVDRRRQCPGRFQVAGHGGLRLCPPLRETQLRDTVPSLMLARQSPQQIGRIALFLDTNDQRNR